MKTEQELARLENFGFTSQGAAIVDAIWFNGAYTSPATQIGMVLICNPEGIWKTYIGAFLNHGFSESHCALEIAHNGAKVPYAIAKAAFPNRPFDNLNYDLAEIKVRG